MSEYRITCRDSGESFSCRNGQSLLTAMEQQGSNVIPVGCRGGGCGFCRIRVISGIYSSRKMSRKHVSEIDQEHGILLACRTYPESNLLFELKTATSVAD